MRRNCVAIERDAAIKDGTLITVKRPPPGLCRIPLRAFGCEWFVPEIIQRYLINRHQATAGASLYRHVAKRHSAFHRQFTNRRACELQRETGAARGADLTDNRQGDIFGGRAPSQPTRDLYSEILHFPLDQTLRSHHVLNFRRADTLRQCAGSAMR